MGRILQISAKEGRRLPQENRANEKKSATSGFLRIAEREREREGEGEKREKGIVECAQTTEEG